MIAAPKPEDERERLQALARYAVLDTPPEGAFDDLVALAGEICGAPIALISLVDAHRQWFKARVGLAAQETPRELAFCAHAILGDEILEVENALEDPRFADNPLVTGDPDIRFYAGAPLITNDGYRLGTLCVIDRVPRRLSERQTRALRVLGRQVIDQLELRHQAAVMARQLLELEAAHRTSRAVEGPPSSDGGAVQRAFLARVTHDLRTPLNAILGFAEFLREDGIDDDERREFAGNIREAGGYMLRLVGDILDLAQLDAGRLRFAREAVDVDAVARAALELTRPLAAGGGNRVIFAGERPGRRITGDPTRLRQVLVNLLSNACKYTRGGEIRLEIADEGDRWIRLDVVDTGVGLRADQRRRLFHAFAQVHDADHQREGTGLGLHVTRGLCERMGGAIAVESEAGVGSTFTVWLPTAPPPAPGGLAVAIADGEPRVRAAIERAIGAVAPRVYVAGASELLWSLAERRWRAVILDRAAADAADVDLLRGIARLTDDGGVPFVVVDEEGAGAAIPGAIRWRVGDDPAALRRAIGEAKRGEST